MYSTPESQLKRMLTAEDLAKLWCAERAGLIPDPWLQSTEICAAIYNTQRAPNTKVIQSEDFLYRVQPKKLQTAEEMQASFDQRKRQAEEINASHR